MAYKITFSNRAYGHAWLKNMRRQSPRHFAILRAVIDEIDAKDGGEISKADLFARRPDIHKIILELGVDLIPSRGQMLKHNGNGIRHAKFAPSKSIAIVWEKIGDLIYVTFDDHAPIRYHRAIWHLRDLKLGRPAFAKQPRTKGRHLRNLRKYWKHRHLRDFRGINLRDRFYE